MLIRNNEFHISFPFWKKYLSLGGPIMVSVLLSGSAQYVNGFIISARFDAATFAIFRYGARELPVVALLAYALSNAMVPVIAREGTDAGLKILKERSGRMAGWMFPLTVVIVLAAYFLFPLIYGKNFTESAGVFNLYLLLITSRLLFPQTILLALQKTGIQMLAALLELILNIGLSLILVRVWGIRGVALATVIAYYFERVFLMAYTRIALRIPVKQYVEVRLHLLWSGVLIIAFLFAELVIGPFMLS
jgi:O-antigen/teichoic acid export membrane protein